MLSGRSRMADTPKSFSLSQLDSYASCSMAYRLERVDRVPRQHAAWFTQGTAAHTAIEQWERHGREIDAVPVFLAEYDAEIAREAKQSDKDDWLRGGRKPTDVDIEQRREIGAAQVRRYMDWAPQQPWSILELPDGSPALELPFRVELPGCERPVIGFIDQVWEWPDGLTEPVDLKTGTKQPKHPRQLGMYKVALEQALGLTVRTGRYLMLKDLDHRQVPLTRYTADYLGGLYGALQRGVENDVFVPDPGDCFTCGVKRHCPEGQI